MEPRISANGAIPSPSPIPSHSDANYAGVSDPERDRREAEREAHIKQMGEIASLTSHPGWRRVRSAIEERIVAYRSGAALKAGIQNGQISNARLGEEVRVAYRMADELETLLTQVETAARQSDAARVAKSKNDRVRPRR